MERVLFDVHESRVWRERIRPALGDGSSVLVTLHVARTFLRLGSNLILTRLLAPEAYGVAGIVTSVAYILTMVSDMGLRSYITRHPTASAELVQTVWTMRFIRNVVLAIIMFGGAGFFAQLYNEPEVAVAIRVASVLFVIDALSSMHFLTNERERRVIRLSVIDFIRFLLVTGITIIAAYYLRNYWAIILSMVVNSVTLVWASYALMRGVPVKFVLRREHIKDVLLFCRYVIPSSIISIVLTQTDRFFIANYFPLAELGKFMLAMAIMLAISSLIGEYVMRVFYPKFAQANREAPESVREVYYGGRRLMTLLLAFAIAGLIGCSEIVVKILFNDEYLGAGLYLSILCLQPLAHLALFPAEQALIAKGFIRVTLTQTILQLVWVLSAGPIAYFQYGPLAVVIVMSLTRFALFPFFWWNLIRHKLFNFLEELYYVAAIAAGLLIGLATNWLGFWLIEHGYLPSF